MFRHGVHLSIYSYGPLFKWLKNKDLLYLFEFETEQSISIISYLKSKNRGLITPIFQKMFNYY